MMSQKALEESNTNSESERTEKVYLHVYDLSMGMAKQLSVSLLGKFVEGIWHTGIVVYGREFFWGGIIQEGFPVRNLFCSCNMMGESFPFVQGKTPYGIPTKVISLGETYIPLEILKEFLAEINSRYTIETYHLLENNCNNFTQEVCQFLTGGSIPSEILNLPTEALNSPLGGMLRELILQYENTIKQQIMSSSPYSIPSYLPIGSSSLELQSSPLVPSSPSNVLTEDQRKTMEIGGNSSKIGSIASPHISDQFKYINKKSVPLISDRGSIVPVINKMKKQFADRCSPNDLQLIDYLSVSLIKGTENTKTQAGNSSHTMLDVFTFFEQWIPRIPITELFATLYVFRLLLLMKSFSEHCIREKKLLLSIFEKFISSTAPKSVCTMALTIATNVFYFKENVGFMISEEVSNVLTERITELLNSDDDSRRLAAATLAYNYSLFLPKQENELRIVQYLTCLLDTLRKPTISDEDTVYRLLLVIGHLILDNPAGSMLVNRLDFKVIATRLSKIFSTGRNAELLKEILSLIEFQSNSN